MSMKRMLTTLIAVLAAVALVACAASSEETKKPAKKLVPLKAKVTAAEKTGTDSGHPIIQVTGTLPGTGWTPEVVTEKTGSGVNIKLMAVPGPGAVQGADVPFTHKFTVTEAGSGQIVHVFDHRGIEIKRVE